MSEVEDQSKVMTSMWRLSLYRQDFLDVRLRKFRKFRYSSGKLTIYKSDERKVHAAVGPNMQSLTVFVWQSCSVLKNTTLSEFHVTYVIIKNCVINLACRGIYIERGFLCRKSFFLAKLSIIWINCGPIHVEFLTRLVQKYLHRYLICKSI